MRMMGEGEVEERSRGVGRGIGGDEREEAVG